MRNRKKIIDLCFHLCISNFWILYRSECLCLNEFRHIFSIFQDRTQSWMMTSLWDITPNGSGLGHVLCSPTFSGRDSRNDSRSRNTSQSRTDDSWRPCWVSLMHRWGQFVCYVDWHLFIRFVFVRVSRRIVHCTWIKKKPRRCIKCSRC